ncbi:MAG: hypothetical protein HN727_14260, partial [Opitutae bacterium]|nr:hypothetical protein [Opitutae bacterium]
MKLVEVGTTKDGKGKPVLDLFARGKTSFPVVTLILDRRGVVVSLSGMLSFPYIHTPFTVNAGFFFFAIFAPIFVAVGDVKTPAIFGNNMVLQRDHANPVWGWGDRGEQVTVTIADQSHRTQADKDGNWRV